MPTFGPDRNDSFLMRRGRAARGGQVHRRRRGLIFYLVYFAFIAIGLWAVVQFVPSDLKKAIRQAYTVDQQQQVGE